ncbi:MAG: hypothetical protein JXQ30_02220 [Spirochaetes bacterium]|nr:hypothetical protein [Spirochaetota bacterium]
MKPSLYISAVHFFVGFLIFSGSGCTNIENPTREAEDDEEELYITAEKEEILDTQPLSLEAEGESGTVIWKTEPERFGRFDPDTGARVTYIPPDVDTKSIVTIVARDDSGRSFSVAITVTDEGPPPGPGDILINEIAWAGTATSPYDEYLEIKNRSERPFYLSLYSIDNAAGKGVPLLFSGRIEGFGLFLIANYPEGSEKSAILCRIDCAQQSLSFSNSTFGPFVLRNGSGDVLDTAGDGGDYTGGLTGDQTASLSRYTHSEDPGWEEEFWYTESACINLSDGTFGTPGAENSDTPFEPSVPGDSALAMITEFRVDAHDETGEDWVELFITRGGNLKYIVVTDLDGTDSSITGGEDVQAEEGSHLVVVWSDSFENDGTVFHIPDGRPPGTKDELAVQSGPVFLDGLCYSVDGLLPNDYEFLCDEGWSGPPVESLCAARRTTNGAYVTDMAAQTWDPEAPPSPGMMN